VSLKSDLQAIEKILSDTQTNAQTLSQTIQQLNQLKLTTTNPQDLAQIEKLLNLTKELRKERKDGAEEERRNLELIAGSNKTLIDLITKLTKLSEPLGNALARGAAAYKSLTKEADLGKAIQHLGAVTPLTRGFGMMLGFVVSTAIKFQDRIQVVNKSIIDLSAATGHYTEGLQLADKGTLEISRGLALYGQQVGIASEQLQKLTGNLGQVGFTLEEMGVDKQTGKITTLSEAINNQSKQWGALSATIGIARMTGLDQGQVISQLQMQVKTLGGTVEGTVRTFA